MEESKTFYAELIDMHVAKEVSEKTWLTPSK